jgi:hypothetical protein
MVGVVVRNGVHRPLLFDDDQIIFVDDVNVIVCVCVCVYVCMYVCMCVCDEITE